MNNPTEHEKQIAKEAAEKYVNDYVVTSNIAPIVEKLTPIILAAITAAKQQRNEDTVRLDWLNEHGRVQPTMGRFPRWEIDTVQIPSDIREAIDSARGVQPAAKEKHDWVSQEGKRRFCRKCGVIEEDGREDLVSCRGAKQEDVLTHDPAHVVFKAAIAHQKEQEGAPAAEQFDVRTMDFECDRAAVEIIAHKTAGDIIAAPSPAREKPVEASVEELRQRLAESNGALKFVYDHGVQTKRLESLREIIAANDAALATASSPVGASVEALLRNKTVYEAFTRAAMDFYYDSARFNRESFAQLVSALAAASSPSENTKPEIAAMEAYIVELRDCIRDLLPGHCGLEAVERRAAILASKPLLRIDAAMSSPSVTKEANTRA
jgi:hypothetical protein